MKKKGNSEISLAKKLTLLLPLQPKGQSKKQERERISANSLFPLYLILSYFMPPLRNIDLLRNYAKAKISAIFADSEKNK